MPKTTGRAALPSLKDFQELRASIESATWKAARSLHADEDAQIGEFEELRSRIEEYAHDLQSEGERMTWDDYRLALAGPLRIILERLEGEQ
jgi:hypothetical protein